MPIYLKNTFLDVTLPKFAKFSLSDYYSEIEKQEFTKLTTNQLAHIHACFVALARQKDLSEEVLGVKTAITVEWLVRNRRQSPRYIKQPRYIELARELDKGSVEEYLLGLREYKIKEKIFDVARSLAKKDIEKTLELFPFEKLTLPQIFELVAHACKKEENAKIVTRKIKKLRLTDEGRGLIALKIAKIVPELLCEVIADFNLNISQRYQVAEMIGDDDHDLLIRYAANFALSKGKEIALRLVKPEKVQGRKAILKGLLFALKDVSATLLSFRVEEHARRRLDFFFFTLILCYNDPDHKYALAGTKLQYLKGSEETDTIGCHSAIMPALKRRANNGKEWDDSFFLKLFLAHAINSTMELPAKVNRVDSFIEGHNRLPVKRENWKLRHFALEILQAVADPHNPMTPHEGLAKFLDDMYRFLPLAADHFRKQNDSDLVRILDYQESATRFVANRVDGESFVKKDYVDMQIMLHLNTKKDKKILAKTGFYNLSRSFQDQFYGTVKNGIFENTVPTSLINKLLIR